MKPYIVTGTPGAGKTTLIHALRDLGHVVVEEAATEVNARMMAASVANPSTAPGFIEAITSLQIERQQAEPNARFFDRSPICTHALAVYLGRPIPDILSREIARMADEDVYGRRVLFIDNLGFCAPTPIRRISFEDSLAFEGEHAEFYRIFGYECIRIPRASVSERVAMVMAAI